MSTIKVQDSPFCGTNNGSTIWTKISTGYRIEDLKEERYNNVLDLIKEYYIPLEVLCKYSKMQNDEQSLKSFLDHAVYIMQKNSSIVLLDENTNDTIVGALLLGVVNKIDFGRMYEHESDEQGEAYNKCLKIETALNKKLDMYIDFDCDTFIRYFLIVIKNCYRGKKLGFQLLRCGLEVARHLHMPIASAIFSLNTSKEIAERLGFKTIHEIRFDEWKDVDNSLIFHHPNEGNDSLTLMVVNVPPPYITEIVRETVAVKGDKKKKKGKNDKKSKKKKK